MFSWILNKFQLWCEMSTVMNLEKNRELIIIREQISSFQIMIIDILMTHAQLQRYVFIHEKLISVLIIKTSKDNNEKLNKKQNEISNQFDMTIYCKLRHASFSSSLKSLYLATNVKKKDNLTTDIQKWREKSNDKLIWLLSHIIEDSVISFLFLNQIFITSYLINVTLKFLTFLKIVWLIMIKKERRLLVFIHWLIS